MACYTVTDSWYKVMLIFPYEDHRENIINIFLSILRHTLYLSEKNYFSINQFLLLASNHLIYKLTIDYSQWIFHKVEIHTLKIMSLTLYMHNKREKKLFRRLFGELVCNLMILSGFFAVKFNFKNYIFSI